MRKIIVLAVTILFVAGIVLGAVLSAKGQDVKAVYVKEDGLYLCTVKEGATPVLLVEGEKISNPILSPNGKWVAYLQDGRLVLQKTKATAGTVVGENPRSFIFDEKNRLVIADANGVVFRADKSGKQTPIKGELVYQDLMLSPDGTVYAHAYEKLVRGTQTVLRPSGIVREEKGAFVTVLQAEKQVPSERNLGFAPKIATFSPTGERAFIFHCPQSTALSADGVSIGVLDLKTGVYTPPANTEQVVIPDRRQVCASANLGETAVVLGFGRNMNKQKMVGILRPEEGVFRPTSADDSTAMMPHLSQDGQRMLYVSASEEADGDRWMELPKSVVQVDLVSGEIQTVSMEKTVYLQPFYAEKDRAVVALRKEQDGRFSLVRMNGDSETVIDDGITCELNGIQYGQMPLERFFARN